MKFQPTYDEILDIVLRAVRKGAEERDGCTVCILPGSEYHDRAVAYAKRVSIAIDQGTAIPDERATAFVCDEGIVDISPVG